MGINELARSDAPLRDSAGDLLRRRVQDRRLQRTSIPTSPGAGPAPLTFAQQRFWFQEQLEPDTAVFNRAHAVRLRGALNSEALYQSLRQIVNRHEILRTTYHSDESGPVQIVSEEFEFTFWINDLSQLGPAEQENALAAEMQEAAERPYDLGLDLMLRAWLWRLGAEDHVLLLGTHHISADGWSDGVLWRELAALYGAAVRGEEATLPDLPLQYADFARFERSGGQSEEMTQHVEYWHERLSGLQSEELPRDRPRPIQPSSKAGIYQLTIGPTLTRQLRDLSSREGVTLYITLLAAFQAFIAHHVQSDDIAVGTAVSGRSRAELEHSIGMFVNTIVMRTNLSTEWTFLDLLSNVRQLALEAFKHQRIPFDSLVRELNPDRSTHRNLLFDVLFQLTAFERDLQLEGLELERLPEMTTGIDMDLDFTFRDEGGHLSAKITFDKDLFDEERIARMANGLRTLLQAVVDDPQTAVSALPILSADERRQILVDWNDTGNAQAQDSLLHELFERQAAQTPDARAVIMPDGRSYNYAQLNHEANRLARILKVRGVGAGDVVGLALDRSLDLTLALLAILKAGAAYLPLDPSYPRERTSAMVRDVALTALITSRYLFEEAADYLDAGGAVVIDLDEIRRELAGGSGENLARTAELDDAAYFIFTSGSTGRPKGVQISQSALANVSMALKDLLKLGPGDRVWQFATINFDTAVEEIYPALISGATVVLRDADIPVVSALNEIITRDNLSVLDLPTAYWHEWTAYLRENGGAIPPGLRLVVVGGEEVESHSYHLWQDLPGSDRVAWLNTYGATELTAVSTAYQAPSGEQLERIPIGRPIANVEAYILNKAMQPVPPGVPGELFFGGAGLAAGYVRNPGLTAEKFIKNPFHREFPALSSKLFRTGDLAYFDEAGQIFYLGRRDHQIKIRGFRIETGEIESWLLRHEDVQQAVVTLVEDSSGGRNLAGYFVGSPGRRPEPAALRTFLADHLPDYMVPAALVELGEMPLNAHGKVDRSALPPPSFVSATHDEQFTGPRTPDEEALAEIWQELLGLESVDVQTNFFDIGGHSLLGVRMFALIESRLGKRLPLSLLFQAPTIAQMATHLDGGDPNAQILVPIREGGSRAPLFVTHGVYGDNLAFLGVASRLDGDQPLYGFQAVGLLPDHEADQSIEEMAARYIDVMQRIQPNGPYHLAGYCFGGKLAYEMACQLAAQNERVALLAIVEGSAPADLHNNLPIYAPQKLQTVRHALPTWLRGYKEFGGWQLAHRTKVKFGRAPRSEAMRASRRLLDEEYDNFADVAAERPEIQYKLRQHHIELHRKYRPGKYDGRILLIRASAVRITRLLLKPFAPLRGWDNLAQGGVDIRYIGGTHFTIVQGKNAADLAAILSQELEDLADG